MPRTSVFSNLPLDHPDRPSNNLPNSVRCRGIPFLSTSNQVRYDEYTLRRVCSGRGVDLGEQYDQYVMDFLEEMGWDNLANPASVVYPEVVRLIYANLEVSDYEEIAGIKYPVTFVNGQHLHITEQALVCSLGISGEGERIFFFKMEEMVEHLGVTWEDYYGSFCVGQYPVPMALKNEHIQPRYLLLKHFLAKNVLPRMGKGDEVDAFLGFVLHCFAVNRPLCLPYIMQRVMFKVVGMSNKTRCLPYGAAWTSIMNACQVAVPTDIAIEATEKAMDMSTVIQTKGFLAATGAGAGEGTSSGRRRSTSDAPRPTEPARPTTRRSGSMRQEELTLEQVNRNVLQVGENANKRISKLNKFVK